MKNAVFVYIIYIKNSFVIINNIYHCILYKIYQFNEIKIVFIYSIFINMYNKKIFNYINFFLYYCLFLFTFVDFMRLILPCKRLTFKGKYLTFEDTLFIFV